MYSPRVQKQASFSRGSRQPDLSPATYKSQADHIGLIYYLLAFQTVYIDLSGLKLLASPANRRWGCNYMRNTSSYTVAFNGLLSNLAVAKLL